MNESAPVEPIWRAPSAPIAKVLFGVLPLLAALGPLLSPAGGLFGFRIACVGIVGYAVVFLMGRRAWSGADVLLLLTTSAFVVSGLVGLPRVTTDSDNPYSELLAVLLGVFAALASRTWQFRRPGIYLALARGWVAAALLMSVLAGVEYVTGLHWPGYLISAHPDPAVTFGNPNALAVFVVMANVWAIPVRRQSCLEWKAATWVLLPATAAVVLLTHARIAMVAWMLIVAWTAWRGLRRSTHPLAGLGEAFVPLAAALGILAVGDRLAFVATEVATADSSGSVRDELVRRGLAISWENLGLPTWPGSFEHFMIEAADPIPVASLVNAHNMWIEILVQYGAVCLVLFLAWLAACVVVGAPARDELAAGTVGLLLLAVVDSSFLDDATLWAFVLTLALASRAGAPGSEPSALRVAQSTSLPAGIP